MAAKRHERTRARRAALQVLYTSEIVDLPPVEVAQSELRLDEGGPLSDYALALVNGVAQNLDEIDKHLSTTSENWSLARMPIIDRSVLRLATYEMMFVDDVPLSVTINEAVELAKDFGGEDESPRFVNGVLGRIARHLEGDTEEAEGESAAAAEDASSDASDEQSQTAAPLAAEDAEDESAAVAKEVSHGE